MVATACAPLVDPGAEGQQFTQHDQVSDSPEVEVPAPSKGRGTRHILSGSTVRWFETPGQHVQTQGRVIRDPNELDAAWDRARNGEADAEWSAPILGEGQAAVLASFTYRGTGSCRVEVELAAVDIRGEQVTLVFEPSGREPCIAPAGVYMVAAILPAEAAGVAEAQRVEAIEQR
jgi:hypothetical protein